MFSVVTTTFQYGEHTVELEMGEIARQASAAVKVDMGGTVALVSVVGKKNADSGRDFFPLTVNYQEKVYAAGKIPGGFFKREGRPSEAETLTARLIDRPIRPLFPAGFMNEVQVIVTIVSINPEVDPAIAAMLGTSAALAASGIPFAGPIGAAQIGFIDGAYVLNPSKTQLTESSLDLMVAGTAGAVLMVESEAKELSEEVMLGAVVFGHDQMQSAIAAIKEFASEVGTPAWDWTAPEKDTALEAKVAEIGEADLLAAFQTADKMERQNLVSAALDKIVAQLIPEDAGEDAPSLDAIKGAFKGLEKKVVRGRVIAGEPRIDGRDTTTVRDIDVRVGVLPRTHGSALFTRGETQALVVTTLGTARDAQIIDALSGEYKDHFLFHYNFPPYCVGETGFVGSPKRREIGHGRLAKRGVLAVMPDQEEFPYTIRVVSEITESNGTREIMQKALDQAHGARLHILDEMEKAISRPREELSEYAPRYVTMKINSDKIREVIGKGGETIRSITEQTGTQIDISDDGTIKIAAVDGVAANKAKAMIEAITAEAEVGKIYEGTVAKIMDFGAFVTILPGKDGLVHISQISDERVEDVNAHLKEGQTVRVKLLEIDRQGRMRLSMKEAKDADAAPAETAAE